MMSVMWCIMLIGGTVLLAVRQGGEAVGLAMIAGAQEAVTLYISLAGGYMLWMGLLGIAERAGLVAALSRKLRGVMKWLFPKADEKASGAITFNLAANMLGMGNAATPFGLEAMREMNRKNPHKGIATHDMCMFLCINASAVQLLPTTLIALRAASGSAHPGVIAVPSLLSSAVATAVAILLCKWQAKRKTGK